MSLEQGREDRKDNDLFFTCGLIDYIARKTKNTRSIVVEKLGKERLTKIYDLADIYHCDNIDKVSDDFIQDAEIKTGNFEMYRKQQALFHQFYIDRCGNSVLITALSRVKSKLFQKPYLDDPEGKMREILYATNKDHREIVKLFRAHDAEGLFRFLSQVHWTPVYAPYDIIV